MNAGEPGTESAIGDQQDVTPHSVDTSLGGTGTSDLDALLGDRPLDANFKRQLEQLDDIDLSHLEEQSTRESTPATPTGQSGLVRNPLAPVDAGQASTSGSRSATPTQSHSRQQSISRGSSSTPIANPLASPQHHDVTLDFGVSTTGPSASSTEKLAINSASNPLESPLTEPATAQTSRQTSLAPTDEELPHSSIVGDETLPNATAARKALNESSSLHGSPMKTSSTDTAGVRGGEHSEIAVNQEPLPPTSAIEDDSANRVSAYARLDFDSFTFYVQTLQVVLGRRSEHGGPSTDVDVHLGPAKAISRRHAKIFYNFATQRFELTVIGRNGAFVGDVFVETGSTVPLRDSTKVQIGQIAFNFVLPIQGKNDENGDSDNENPVIEELEIEDTGDNANAKRAKAEATGGKATKAKPIALGSEKGRGGKLKQRAQSKSKKAAESSDIGSASTSATTLPASDMPSAGAALQQHDGEASSSLPVNASNLSVSTSSTASTSSETNNNGNTASLGMPNTINAQDVDPSIQNMRGSTARNKPRQASFLKRADENNLFAHVPPDQLAAVNAQVDAAIAGLPDIPGFDTPALNTGTGGASSTLPDQNMQNRITDTSNLNQLLGLQTQLGLQQPNVNNLSNLNTLMGIGGNLGGFQGLQQGAGSSATSGLQSLQQLQALQSLQGLDGLQGLQGLAGIQGFQGLQPAAGLGLLQQLQALQRNKAAATPGAQQPQTRQKRKPKREYRPEEIPEQYRTKPAHSYSHLITAALRDRLSNMPEGTQGGLSLGDIYEAIMDLFPYYRYCPPGWQNSVRHNLSSSKSFRKVSKEGKGWLWGLDEEYLAEKEKQRQRALQRQQQQALAQQQAMAEQHAREQAREQARQLQLQRDRDRELEQRRFLAERAARAAQVGVPLHQLSATLGTTNLQSLTGSEQGNAGSFGSRFDGIGSGARGVGSTSNSSSSTASKPAVLPPETVKLLAGLQQHVQQELAKDGQPPLNPQLLSNALAVVIAQTAKQAGGLQNLGSVLQQPGAVQKLLGQAMQLLRSTQRVPAPAPKPSTTTGISTGAAEALKSSLPSSVTPVTSTSPPSTSYSKPTQPSPAAPSSALSSQNSAAEPLNNKQTVPEATSPSTGAQLPSTAQSPDKAPAGETGSEGNTHPSSAQIQAQPHIQSSSVTEKHSQSDPATQQAQPHILQPAKSDMNHADDVGHVNEASADKTEESASAKKASDEAESNGNKNGEKARSSTPETSSSATVTVSATPSSRDSPSAEPSASSKAAAVPKTKQTGTQQKKQQPSLEKISEILAKAEAIPNPTPEVKGMIEKLKSHKRQLELKRAAETSSSAQPPAPKRPAVE